ncbi:MAG: hypothetical protein A2Y88_14025 [Chloroflexi bacterium RBG_13_48_10]|nr:MAG: hypothetical protein A2Y88_14025 [Chloroflexi bacterium RBG_13_48_10]
MSKKTIGFVLIALGVVIGVVSLAADAVGIGNQQGIGWKQLLGTAIGVIVVFVGVWMTSRKPNLKK